MIDNLRKRYEQLQGLLNTPNNQGGGLLGNIPQSVLLGSAIYGQGIQGKDPFAALLPAVTQTAQLKKLMTPKQKDRKMVKGADGFNYYADTGERVLPGVQAKMEDTRTQLQKNLEAAGLKKGTPEYNLALMENVNPVKDTRTSLAKNLEAAGFVEGTPEYQDAMKLRTLPEGTVPFSGFQKKANIDKANINANYAIEGIDLLTSVASIGAKSPNTFGLKGSALGLAKNISTEIEGIYKGFTKKAADKGGITSSAYEFLGDPNFTGIQPLENALAIHIARNRNPSGRLMKDMIADAKGDASLQGLGGAEKVAQRLPFIFKEFLDTATNQYKAAGKSDEEIAKILNPKIKEFNESLNVLTGVVKPKIIPVDPFIKKDNMPKKGEDGIWRF